MRGCSSLFFFYAHALTEIYTLSLHDALPILRVFGCSRSTMPATKPQPSASWTRSSGGSPLGCWLSRRTTSTLKRSEEHTSELQSLRHLVCRLLLEKKKITKTTQQEKLHQSIR